MLDEIIADIKRKRELSRLSDTVVREKVTKALAEQKELRKKIAELTFKQVARSSVYKEFLKKIRKELREIYGVFNLDKKKEHTAALEAGDTKKLLGLHQSSKERLLHYNEIYRRLFEITGKPEILLDLGCGANPYAYEYLGCSPFYIAMDLPSGELDDIAAFFKKKKIDGCVHGIDLVKEYHKIESVLGKKKIDIIFLFKVLDGLETIKRNISRSLLSTLKATWIVVSFPTMSLGGKRHIKKERRAWFEKLLTREGKKYQTIEIENEIFYVIQ